MLPAPEPDTIALGGGGKESVDGKPLVLALCGRAFGWICIRIGDSLELGCGCDPEDGGGLPVREIVGRLRISTRVRFSDGASEDPGSGLCGRFSPFAAVP